MSIHRFPLPALAILLVCTSAVPGHAETLREALAAAYRNNPTLTAARAGQRATDETVGIEKANGRPDITVQSQYSQNAYVSGASAFTANRSLTTTLQATVPLYQGGQVRNAVKGDERRVEAGRFDLRGTELTVFSQVVAAYMDVIRTGAIVSLSGKNVNVLEINLKATRNRFEVGDVTRTDVAQSEARLELAKSDLRTAESDLISARETYIQLIGHAPAHLQDPPPLINLPKSAENAVTVALAQNPDLAAAKTAQQAAKYDVRAARGSRLPTLSAFSQGQNYSDLGSASQFQTLPSNAVVVGAQLSIPLYQGGGPGARVRRSEALEQQAMEQQTAAERDVVAQTRSLYSSWQASEQVIASTKVAVSANELSLRGVRAENSVGTRTILDILNAEQEAFSSKVQLVTAQRNAYVAAFSLLAAMGQVDAVELGIKPADVYDPMTHYDRVKGKWSDWDDGERPAPIATRTVDSPPQKATVTDIVNPQ